MTAHIGTLGYDRLPGSSKVVRVIACTCGQKFPTQGHPVEVDHLESPEWDAHVQAAHREG